MTLNKVLIDTNICLDAVLNRHPFATSAAKITEQSEKGLFSGLIAAHTFDTFFYILVKNIGQTKAYRGINALRRAFEVAAIDKTIIDNALDLNWPDFEDAIHYQAAIATDCHAIVTRNKQDFSEGRLPVLSPSQFLEELDT